jgi:hypothetical protein
MLIPRHCHQASVTTPAAHEIRGRTRWQRVDGEPKRDLGGIVQDGDLRPCLVGRGECWSVEAYPPYLVGKRKGSIPLTLE